MPYDPTNNPYIPGDPYSYDLKWMVDKIQEWTDPLDSAERAEASAQAAEADRQQAEAWAVGTIDGDPVTPSDPQYQNYAHYWSVRAGVSAIEAADYAAHIADPVSGLVTTWLDDHITNPSSPPVDTSLSVGGAAADAAVTGDKFKPLDASDYIEVPYFTTSGHFVSYSDGTEVSDSNFRASNFLYVGDAAYLIFKPYHSTASNPTGGAAFYTDTNAADYLSGIQAVGSQPSTGYDDWTVVAVPSGAKFFKASVLSNTGLYGDYPNIYKALPYSAQMNKINDPIYKYDVTSNYNLNWASDKQVSPTDGKYKTNSTIPYRFGEQQYSFIPVSSLAMKMPGGIISVNYYSAISEASYLYTKLFDGDELTVLSPEIDGKTAVYMRFCIWTKDHQTGTAGFNAATGAFKLYSSVPFNRKIAAPFYFFVDVNAHDPQGTDGETTVQVDCAFSLPSTYSEIGKPVPLVFMHHGKSATIDATNQTWCSQYANWSTLISTLNTAGYAVFDINGYDQAPNGHSDYSCPVAVRAFTKAYEYITSHYNVQKQIYSCGYSMGTTMAVTIAKQFPRLVKAVGLFCPVLLQQSASGNVNDEIIATAYGYADAAAMRADDYAKLMSQVIGVNYYDSNGIRVFKNAGYNWFSNPDNLTVEVTDIFMPIKSWTGENDGSASPDAGLYIQEAMFNGCKEAYFHQIPGGTHTIGAGGNTTVNDELVLWLNRFEE